MNAVVEKKPVDYSIRLSRHQAEYEEAKKKLDLLIEKRIKELGELAFKSGLDIIPNKILEEAFTKIKEQHRAKESA